MNYFYMFQSIHYTNNLYCLEFGAFNLLHLRPHTCLCICCCEYLEFGAFKLASFDHNVLNVIFVAVILQ